MLVHEAMAISDSHNRLITEWIHVAIEVRQSKRSHKQVEGVRNKKWLILLGPKEIRTNVRGNVIVQCTLTKIRTIENKTTNVCCFTKNVFEYEQSSFYSYFYISLHIYSKIAITRNKS